MRKYFLVPLLLLFASITATIGLAQSPAEPVPMKHYKTDFVVKEIDPAGHVANSRSYSTILATNNTGKADQIRSGDRVPIRVSTTEKGDLQYIDIGVNIDCTYIQVIDQKLAMSIKAEVSSVPAGTDLNTLGDPLIRQFQWNSDVIVTPGTPTTVFSSDDVTSKTKVQLEVTATLIK